MVMSGAAPLGAELSEEAATYSMRCDSRLRDDRIESCLSYDTTRQYRPGSVGVKCLTRNVESLTKQVKIKV